MLGKCKYCARFPFCQEEKDKTNECKGFIRRVFKRFIR